ncbi:putative TonB-dependent receptor [Nitrospira sp. KM1]|uniref:TonB-dependent receptor family protein n=1 Tax=Nitrospira sp. KM1 TaxID=1936990 RepID=UPI0013A796E8|nr:TonB-dependent receptor [Nitrospira sp. KM1]BCA55764.1 putative TonB-dependent receptor [Nitrospira sp. KM1]
MLYALAVVFGSLVWSSIGAAQDTSVEPAPSARETELRDQLKGILQELEDIQHKKEQAAPEAERAPVVKEKTSAPAPESEHETVPEYELADMSIVSKRMQKRPEGVSISATIPAETDSQPTRTMKESMESIPGVVLRQANGPRDFSIMIRGQGAKTAFAVRDIKVYEDGFIQTQSDGLSRLDMQDPWFMRSTEVTRGASSSLYDNYALGGMVQFRTRRGSDINGFEAFLQGGSYGFQKQAFAVGQQFENLDVSLFGSNAAEDGYIRNSDYSTQTINFNLRFKIDDKQNFYFKAISNWLDTRVPTRLTQAQFTTDDRQAGGAQTTCVSGTYMAGCANATLLHQQRIDRRTIVGGIYERQLNAGTVLTIEGDYDVKDINQYFSQITDNVNPNVKSYADLRNDSRVGGMPLRSYVGFFINNMEQEGNTFQNLADGQGTRGSLLQNNRGTIRNIGGRIREELEFVPKWILAAGLGFEQSMISVQSINYTGATPSPVSANRTFYNWAPEVSLSWKPEDGYRTWIRASTGYGIPQFNNLLRDPVTGLPGTNFDLKPQKNLNTEIGTEARLHRTLGVQLVGFWTFFKNEIITQTISGGNTASVNADSSQYRGIEASYDWRPLSGLRLSGAYTHIDARYINFSDRVAAGFLSRDGKNVPNVPTDVLHTKAEYDHALSGWGGWIEASYYNSYFLNNSNTFGIPSYLIANINVHKTVDVKSKWFRFAKFYLELDNIADKKYVASGQVIGGETTAAGASQQAFFAGYGRAIYGGVTLGLF